MRWSTPESLVLIPRWMFLRTRHHQSFLVFWVWWSHTTLETPGRVRDGPTVRLELEQLTLTSRETLLHSSHPTSRASLGMILWHGKWRCSAVFRGLVTHLSRVQGTKSYPCVRRVQVAGGFSSTLENGDERFHAWVNIVSAVVASR